MITNERQYKITKRKERSFHEAIERFDAQGSEASDVHPRRASVKPSGRRWRASLTICGRSLPSTTA